MKSENPGHIPVIDTLRGIAASAVMLFHFVSKTGTADHPWIQSDVLREITRYGQYGVHMFFVISGVVIPLSMIKGKYTYSLLGRFLAKRFIRLEPPYLCAVVLATVYLIARNHVPGSAATDLTPDMRSLMLHIGYLIPFFSDAHWVSDVFWTLAVEFQYYILLALVFPLALSSKLTMRLVFYAIIASMSFFTTETSFIFHWLPVFLLGILLAMRYAGRIAHTEFLISMLFALGLLLWINGPVVFLFAASTGAFILFFRQFNPLWGQFLGKISYSLYLLHAIIGSAAINFLSHRFTTPITQTLVVAGGVALSIVSAWIFYKLIELPSQRWSSRIKLKSQSVSKNK
jgi:peptidoglycan/LPS O-acetylase OafA/YrhL